MQRDESARGRDSNEPEQVVLRGMLGEEVINTASEAEAMMLKKMQARLAWNAKYIDMLEDLICHYQREVNFWKGRE
jgi:hypothetical protein